MNERVVPGRNLAERKLTLRTADQTRHAEVDFDEHSLGNELIQAAVENWSLPQDVDYALVNTTTGRALTPSQAVGAQVSAGDVLEVQPVLVAGADGRRVPLQR